METVDSEHIQLFENIDAGNLESAQKILGHHISNVKKHAILSIERMNREKKIKIIWFVFPKVIQGFTNHYYGIITDYGK